MTKAQAEKLVEHVGHAARALDALGYDTPNRQHGPGVLEFLGMCVRDDVGGGLREVAHSLAGVSDSIDSVAKALEVGLHELAVSLRDAR